MGSCRSIFFLSYKPRYYIRNSSSEKSRNNTREIWYFFKYVWYHQSAAATSLSFRATRSGWWVNDKAFTTLNSCLLVGSFSYMAVNQWKIRLAYRQWHSNFPRRERKPNCEKVTYSVAFVMTFLAAENENRQIEDLPWADFNYVAERFL